MLGGVSAGEGGPPPPPSVPSVVPSAVCQWPDPCGRTVPASRGGRPRAYCEQDVLGTVHNRANALTRRRQLQAVGVDDVRASAEPVSTARVVAVDLLGRLEATVREQARLAERVLASLSTMGDPAAVAAQTTAATEVARADALAARAGQASAVQAAAAAAVRADAAEADTDAAEHAAAEARAQAEQACAERDAALKDRDALTVRVDALAVQVERDAIRHVSELAAAAEHLAQALEVAEQRAGERDEQAARAAVAEDAAERARAQTEEVRADLGAQLASAREALHAQQVEHATTAAQLVAAATRVEDMAGDLMGVRAERDAAQVQLAAVREQLHAARTAGQDAVRTERVHADQRIADLQAAFAQQLQALTAERDAAHAQLARPGPDSS